jgi:hypothetical protein
MHFLRAYGFFYEPMEFFLRKRPFCLKLTIWSQVFSLNRVLKRIYNTLMKDIKIYLFFDHFLPQFVVKNIYFYHNCGQKNIPFLLTPLFLLESLII